jgi:hypothetical protein
MALTGRFNLRKTFGGRIVLQVEEEVEGFWGRMMGRPKLHRRWRDAKVLDLAAPELRSLVDLRFRPRYMPQSQANESAQDLPKAPPPLEALPAQTLHYETYDENGRFSTH